MDGINVDTCCIGIGTISFKGKIELLNLASVSISLAYSSYDR